MSNNNISNALTGIFRSMSRRSRNRDSSLGDHDRSNAEERRVDASMDSQDNPTPPPVTDPPTTVHTPSGDAGTSTSHTTSAGPDGYQSDSSMPVLQDVSDSDNDDDDDDDQWSDSNDGEDETHGDNNMDTTEPNDGVNVIAHGVVGNAAFRFMQTAPDNLAGYSHDMFPGDEDEEMPPLDPTEPPRSSSTSSGPQGTRRPRVEDDVDGDSERDRRHPSQRASFFRPSVTPVSSFSARPNNPPHYEARRNQRHGEYAHPSSAFVNFSGPSISNSGELSSAMMSGAPGVGAGAAGPLPPNPHLRVHRHHHHPHRPHMHPHIHSTMSFMTQSGPFGGTENLHPGGIPTPGNSSNIQPETTPQTQNDEHPSGAPHPPGTPNENPTNSFGAFLHNIIQATAARGGVFTTTFNGVPINGDTQGNPTAGPGEGANGGPRNAARMFGNLFTALDSGAFAINPDGFGGTIPLFGFRPVQEREDPERAKVLVDGLEEVPVGLIRRLERISREGKPNTGEDQTTQGEGCAVCWERLIEDDDVLLKMQEEEEKAAEKEVTADGGEQSVAQSTLNKEDTAVADTTPAASSSSASASASDASATATKRSPKYPRIVTLPCAHIFHADCLLPWFTRPRQTTCPTCRFNIDPEGLTQGTTRRRAAAAAATGGERSDPAGASVPHVDGGVPLPGNQSARRREQGRQPAPQNPQSPLGLFGFMEANGAPNFDQGQWDTMFGAHSGSGRGMPFNPFSPTGRNVPHGPPRSSSHTGPSNRSANSGDSSSPGSSGPSPAENRPASSTPDGESGSRTTRAGGPATSPSASNTPPASSTPTGPASAQTPQPNAQSTQNSTGQQIPPFGPWMSNEQAQTFAQNFIGRMFNGGGLGRAPQTPRTTSAPGAPTSATPTSNASSAPPSSSPDINAAPPNPNVPHMPHMHFHPGPGGHDEHGNGFMTIGIDVIIGHGPPDAAGDHNNTTNDDTSNGNATQPTATSGAAGTNHSNVNPNPTMTGAPGGFSMNFPGLGTALPFPMGGFGMSIPMDMAHPDDLPFDDTGMEEDLDDMEFGVDIQYVGGDMDELEEPEDDFDHVAAYMHGPFRNEPSMNAPGATNMPFTLVPNADGGFSIAPSTQQPQAQPQQQPRAPSGTTGTPAASQPHVRQSSSRPQANDTSNSSTRPRARPTPAPHSGIFAPWTTPPTAAAAATNAPTVPNATGSTNAPSQARGNSTNPQSRRPRRERAAGGGSNAGTRPPNPLAFVTSMGPGMPTMNPNPAVPDGGSRNARRSARAPRERRPWAPPAPPGLTLRQRIEKREREAGLRCWDVSCGVGPSDEDPFVVITEAQKRQLRIRQAATVSSSSLPEDAKGKGKEKETEDEEAEPQFVCEHMFHPPCIVSAQRVALNGAEENVVEGGKAVEVSCSVCRATGVVTREDWEEGVRALEC